MAITSRDRQLIRLWSLGLSDRETAKAAGISYWTVMDHKDRLKFKLGVDSKPAIVREARRLGIAA